MNRFFAHPVVRVAVLAAPLSLLVLGSLDRSAHATRYGRREQLALARVCVSEAGWEATPECAAIHQVLADRARQMEISYMAALCFYSTRTCDRGRRDPRRWIAWLSPDLRRPRGWPDGMLWSRYRPRWRVMLKHAGAVLRNEVESPCETPPHYWGMPRGIDLERALQAGWRRLECEGTRNAFWRVPHRESVDAT